MEIRDVIMMMSAIIVILGWFLNSYLNRKHEIAKKRLDYRLNALTESLNALILIRNKKIDLEVISEAHFNFQLYASKDELDLLDSFIKTKSIETLNKLIFLHRKKIRKELNLPYFKLQDE